MKETFINSPLGTGGKLSMPSRILVAFASGALIAVFFLPAWRINLFAPQYPEGLVMNIWINGLSGDVDIINGLNHYIGMEKISEKMFPEFSFLPYVVGFFMLLGIMVSITGSRKLLLIYLGLTVMGGALAMYDFYQWGYKYGHNLNQDAPIQIPNFSYQPPLIGHKRILNFDAYSFPDIGGWIVIAAAALAFGVWFAEGHKSRKSKSKLITEQNSKNMVSLTTSIIIGLMLTSCKANTEPFDYGKDNCYFCKMGIVDPKFGGQVVTKKGKVYKFDDVVCIVRFLHSGTLNENEIAKKVIINFKKQNDFLDVNKSFFWVNAELRSPMGSNAAAFASQQEAENAKGNKEGEIVKWDTLYEKVK